LIENLYIFLSNDSLKEIKKLIKKNNLHVKILIIESNKSIEESSISYFKLFKFIFNKIKNKREKIFSNNIIIKQTKFFSKEIFSNSNRKIFNILNEIQNNSLLKQEINYKNYELFLLDRAYFVNFLTRLLLNFESFKLIFEKYKPSKVFISDSVPKLEFNLIKILQKEFNFKLIQLTHKKNANYFFNKLQQKFRQFILYRIISNIYNDINSHYTKKEKLEIFKRYLKLTLKIFLKKNYKKNAFLKNQKNSNKPYLFIYIITENHFKSILPILKELKKIKKYEYDIQLFSSVERFSRLSLLAEKENYFINYISEKNNSRIFDIPWHMNKKCLLIISQILSKYYEDQFLNKFISKSIIKEIEKRTVKLINWINLFENLLNRIGKIDLIIILNEFLPKNRILVEVGKKYGIKSLFIPHAQIGFSPYRSKLIVDFMAASGQSDVDFYTSLGTPKEKLIITGHPKYDEIFRSFYKLKNSVEFIKNIRNKFNISIKKKLILVASTSGDLNIYIRRSFLKTTLIKVKKRKDLEAIIKLHPRESISLAKTILNEIKEHVPIVKSFSLYKLIIASDLVISYNSGVTFESMLFNRPTIDVNFTNTDSYNYKKFNAAYQVNEVKKIPFAIDLILDNDKVKNEIIEGQKKYVNYYLYKFDGKSAYRIAKLIEKLISL